MPSTPKSTAISSHLVVRPDWLAKRRETVLEPDLPIIDPHHHLIDRPASGTYLLPDLLADIGSGHNIVATVYLEWLSMYRADGPEEMRPVGEIEFAKMQAIKTKTNTLAQASMKLGEAMYKQQAEADAAKDAAKDDVVDAEFTEVDDDKNTKKWTCFKRKHVDLVDKSKLFKAAAPH